MKRWMQRLGSLKLTVFLLVFMVLVLAAGTVVESLMGTQKAQAIYFAPWFLGLQFLFGVNIVCSMIVRWPWDRSRVGFVLTHGSLGLILLGALGTAAFKQEGQLALWEGDQSSEFVNAYTPGEVLQLPIPFAIKLDAFEIDYYPGTRRPAQFRSRVQVIDSEKNVSFPAVIEMNRELSYRGYNFYQSSYRQESGREMTILSVSRDRAQLIVFAGYVLLIVGMITVFFTRLGTLRRQQATGMEPASMDAPKKPSPFNIVGGFLVATLLASGVVMAQDFSPGLPSPELSDALRDLPVQHDGRAMPLDTLAREATLRVTGQRTWQSIDPVALVLGWRFDPEFWSQQAVVKLDSAALATQTNLATSAGFVSFAAVANNQALLNLMKEARRKSQLEEALGPDLQAAEKLEGRLRWLQGFFNGSRLNVVPAADPNAAWTGPGDLSSADGLVALREQLAGAAPDHYPSARSLSRETLYNSVRSTRVAWLLLLPASLLALAGYLRPHRLLNALTAAPLIAGFGVMTWGLAARWQIAGRIPASNMYESMLFLGWGVGLFAAAAALANRNRLLVLNATFMSALCMLLLDLLPMDGFIHPMPPVLTGTPWLAIHVPITMISYSVFAIGVLIAHAQIVVEMTRPANRTLVNKLNEMLYLYLHIGSILLAAGIFTGSIWAASSWGRYWGWDPKEVWSLIALLAYMAILHGRFDRMIGHFGTAAWSILAFLTVLMTYLGVNFILSAGLHSYGFGESAVTQWLVLFALAELLFLGVATILHLRRSSLTTSSSTAI
jgi:cytochrome c-type biogenesis protein CcsB